MEKSSINSRIKKIRLSKGLNQAEFGEAIGLKQVAISKMEQEGNTVTTQNVKYICEKFRVRRQWLETGEGEMTDSDDPVIFSEFAQEFNLSGPERAAAKYLLQLSSIERHQILKYMLDLAHVMDEAAKEESEKAARRADLHRQLDEGLVAEEKGAVAYSSISSKKQA
jgi:transcriptional regulator with XRE-family HTH domain